MPCSSPFYPSVGKGPYAPALLQGPFDDCWLCLSHIQSIPDLWEDRDSEPRHTFFLPPHPSWLYLSWGKLEQMPSPRQKLMGCDVFVSFIPSRTFVDYLQCLSLSVASTALSSSNTAIIAHLDCCMFLYCPSLLPSSLLFNPLPAAVRATFHIWCSPF